jgi:hypothetical protein
MFPQVFTATSAAVLPGAVSAAVLAAGAAAATVGGARS